ncbi:hypothetical protein CS062_09295 [Roseateles chitinivorans]|uniref:J domain-containing protein n=1 Tax=Roseateles chitinivorans TaxID=2917965 RepID=A0A2G9CAS9_9BURK|nr:hypothetical protein [Roseateles chitinivorans]PIM53513.1 hypothetical protein CS062_09295 [Roseateles chitinivorans]
MPVYLPSYFVALGLDETATEADVKAAYASRLKQLDRARDPLGFQDLRGHYEAAIAHLREGRGFLEIEFLGDEPETAPASAPAPAPAPAPASASSPSPQPDLEIDPARVAEAAYEAFLAAFWRLDARALAAAVGVLRDALASPALASLAAREAFERRVVGALLSRSLRRRSGLLLFAAIEAFRWSERVPLAPPGSDESGLHRWMDAALLLDERDRTVWLWLAEEPRPMLIGAAPLHRNFDWNSAVREICCQPGELGAWHALAAGEPVAPSPADAAPAPRLGDSPLPSRTTLREWLQWLMSPAFLLLVAPLLIAGLVMGLLWLRGEGREPENRLTCAARFAAAAQGHWKGLSIGQVEQLNRCAHEAPPPTCEDRGRLKRLNRLAAVLIGSQDGGPADVGYFFGKDEVVLDPEDGQWVATRGEPCGRAAWELYRTGGWLRLGHGPTAEAIVRRGAVCTEMAGSGRGGNASPTHGVASEWAADDWVFKLLSRTDAWQVATHPNGLEGIAPAPIKLDSLVSTDPKLTEARVESWEGKAPACVAAGG